MQRARERQLEVLVELQSFCAPIDFEEMAWLAWRHQCEAKADYYHTTKALDPGVVNRWKALQYERRQPRTKRKLRNADAREMRRMYAAGASPKMLRQAFKVTPAAVDRILSGRTHADAGGPLRPMASTGRAPRLAHGADNGRAILTQAIVDGVLAMPKASLSQLSRKFGVSMATARRVRIGETFLQRAQHAQAAE